MEGEEIGLVLARASDLRSRISACAAAAAAGAPSPWRDEEEEEEEEAAVKRLVAAGDEDEDDEEEKQEVKSLVGISDALESLERQLAALQDLQHQQRYERETILSQIDRSRRSLLNKLKEHKGQDSEVIHEAAAFAGEKIEHDDGLVLPPYPNHVTNSFALDDLYPLSYMSKCKRSHDGLDSSNGTARDSAKTNGPASRDADTSRRSLGRGIGAFIGRVAKMAVMVVGAVSIMKAAGYEPVISGVRLDVTRLLGGKAKVVNGSGGEERSTVWCPPGTAMVAEEDGSRARCIVKERVEVPFDAALPSLSSSYGLG